MVISILLSLVLFWLSIQFQFQSRIGSPNPKAHLLSRTPHTPSKTIFNNEPAKQRMLFLAGPHKTSSSSIQINLLEWITTPPTSQTSFQQWTWPLPTELYDAHNCTLEPSKSFYVYMEALKEMKKHGRCLRKYYSADQVRDLYQEIIWKEWKTGKHVLIATEAMDYIGTNRPQLMKKDVLQKLLLGMPWNFNRDGLTNGSQDDITVVVSYRSPRIKHLKSLWHQCCKEESFQDYLTQRLRTRMDPLRALDSLFLADTFLIRGLNVVLLDMGGVLEQGYDMASVIACDILQVDCAENKSIVGIKQDPKIMNVRSDSDIGNVTEVQLSEIDELIKKYDCNFRHLMGHENLTVMYGTDLQLIWKDCESLNTKDRIQSREHLVNSIIQIASTNV